MRKPSIPGGAGGIGGKVEKEPNGDIRSGTGKGASKFVTGL